MWHVPACNNAYLGLVDFDDVITNSLVNYLKTLSVSEANMIFGKQHPWILFYIKKKQNLEMVAIFFKMTAIRYSYIAKN